MFQEQLAESGWARCASVADAVARAGLPAITRDYLATAFPSEVWAAARAAVNALTKHFASARYADETTWGVLLVPDPALLDTRRPMTAAVRADQTGTDDVFDERLPAGVLSVPSGRPWRLVATVTGVYGPSLGSHDQVVAAPAADFTVAGLDTRTLMTRQIWGARVLQSGRELPDCEVNDRWTFTLFPGEALVDGQAESGTVLKSKVRFRLGRSDRDFGSARVAPAIG